MKATCSLDQSSQEWGVPDLFPYISQIAGSDPTSANATSTRCPSSAGSRRFAKVPANSTPKIGGWGNYPLRDWIASTDHVPTWVPISPRLPGRSEGSLALKVGCLAARRAGVLGERGRQPAEPREVIEQVESSVKYGRRGAQGSVKGAQALPLVGLRSRHVRSRTAWRSPIPRGRGAGASVIDTSASPPVRTRDDCYCLAGGVMATLIGATGSMSQEYVQDGLVYTERSHRSPTSTRRPEPGTPAGRLR